MTGETCKFNQLGFCKFKNNCRKKHIDVKCNFKKCEITLCEKRHPRNCYYFNINKQCKYGSFCRYEHQQNVDNSYIINTKIKMLESALIEHSRIIGELKCAISEKDKNIEDLWHKLESWEA